MCGVEWRCLLISFVFCHWMVHGGGEVSCKHPLSCSPLRPSVSGRSVGPSGVRGGGGWKWWPASFQT